MVEMHNEEQRVQDRAPPTRPGFYWVWDEHKGQIVVWVFQKDVLLREPFIVEIPGSDVEWAIDSTRFRNWGEQVMWPGIAEPVEDRVQRLEAENGRLATELGKRGKAPLDESSVRSMVSGEMARILLGQVLVSENSHLLAEAKQMKQYVGKLDAECVRLQTLVGETDRQRREALEALNKSKLDAQQWAGDYLRLARLLGVPENVKDRTIVDRAEELVKGLAVAMVDRVAKELGELLIGFDGTSHQNLVTVVRNKLASLKGGAW